MNKKIIAVDIDGYIADGKFWEDECRPRAEVIKHINTLYKRGHIIIYYTARHLSYYELTYAWLIKNGCYFHSLNMGKMTADVYLDDRNGFIGDILAEQESNN